MHIPPVITAVSCTKSSKETKSVINTSFPRRFLSPCRISAETLVTLCKRAHERYAHDCMLDLSRL